MADRYARAGGGTGGRAPQRFASTQDRKRDIHGKDKGCLKHPLNRLWNEAVQLRSSRRRILPTGVLGSSVRNSITRGCL